MTPSRCRKTAEAGPDALASANPLNFRTGFQAYRAGGPNEVMDRARDLNLRVTGRKVCSGSGPCKNSGRKSVGAAPFVIAMLIMVGMLLAYPEVALWLPQLFY